MHVRCPSIVSLAFLISACGGGDDTPAQAGDLQADDGEVASTGSEGRDSDEDDGNGTTTIGTTTSSEGESDGSESHESTSDATSSSSEGTGDDTTTDAEDEGEGEASSGSAGADGLPMEESFTGDGGPWPAPWSAVGTAVLAADLAADRGRLAGAMGYVARMILPGYAVVDLDATVVVAFDDATRQGFGFYARQNGGVLHETEPPGQGYCVYVEGEGVANLAIWRELGGVEQLLAGADNPIAGGIQPGVDYALRLQIVQSGATTELRTKMWRADEAQPPTWAVELEDATAELQGTAGSFAVDLYNYDGTGSVYIDDIVVTTP